jgi:hypothetical protein
LSGCGRSDPAGLLPLLALATPRTQQCRAQAEENLVGERDEVRHPQIDAEHERREEKELRKAETGQVASQPRGERISAV